MTKPMARIILNALLVVLEQMKNDEPNPDDVLKLEEIIASVQKELE